MTELVMPKLGITMDEGTVTEWRLAEGAAYKAGDVLLVVETDKAQVDVPAPEEGVLLKILVPAGQTVPVGAPIAQVGRAGEAAASAPAPAPPAAALAPADASAPAAAPVPAAPTLAARERLRTSPLARRLAAQHGLDLATLRGTGPRGRVIRADIEAALAARDAAPGPAPTAPAPASGAPAAPSSRLEPLSRMRRVIAERMTASAQSIPTFRLTMPADVTASLALRQALSGAGVKLSLNDLLIQAVARALLQHPLANASFVPGADWASSQIRYHDHVNLGLATAVSGGLVVPVLPGAQALGLVDISRQRRALVAAAQAGRLLPDQLTGGTFTISNLGPYGIEQFDAIINPPEAAILAVGRAAQQPVIREGNLQTRTIIYLTLTCDHRVLDGAAGAQFLAAVVQRLEAADGYSLL